jgi:hypothetical protein
MVVVIKLVKVETNIVFNKFLLSSAIAFENNF